MSIPKSFIISLLFISCHDTNETDYDIKINVEVIQKNKETYLEFEITNLSKQDIIIPDFHAPIYSFEFLDKQGAKLDNLQIVTDFDYKNPNELLSIVDSSYQVESVKKKTFNELLTKFNSIYHNVKIQDTLIVNQNIRFWVDGCLFLRARESYREIYRIQPWIDKGAQRLEYIWNHKDDYSINFPVNWEYELIISDEVGEFKILKKRLSAKLSF